jgi:hypothetical protein
MLVVPFEQKGVKKRAVADSFRHGGAVTEGVVQQPLDES